MLGNLAGLFTVIALTCMLRYLPLGIVFPVTTGTSILGVQIVAARWLFHEPISAVQWAGFAVGLLLVQHR